MFTEEEKEILNNLINAELDWCFEYYQDGGCYDVKYENYMSLLKGISDKINE